MIDSFYIGQENSSGMIFKTKEEFLNAISEIIDDTELAPQHYNFDISVEVPPFDYDRLMCYQNLKCGDRIWYTDGTGVIESGTVKNVYVDMTNAKIKTTCFTVDFDDGDYDEFVGDALGDSVFLSEKEACAARFADEED